MTVRPVSFGEAGRFSAELDAHHWLGHRLTGQVLRYVAELDGQWVAVAGFGSAALSCAVRDRFIGWSREQQYARLILYRVKTRRRDAGLRFGLVGRLRHDRGSCLSVCCI